LTSASILIVDDDDDLRAILAQVIAYATGEQCVCLPNHAALVGMGEQVRTMRLAILDINLGPNAPSGIDSYRWLRSIGYGGRVVFFTGHARSHPVVARAHEVGDATVLQKPVRFDLLCKVIDSESGRPAW
jgi:FixJ family two-component response regulator